MLNDYSRKYFFLSMFSLHWLCLIVNGVWSMFLLVTSKTKTCSTIDLNKQRKYICIIQRRKLFHDLNRQEFYLREYFRFKIKN